MVHSFPSLHAESSFSPAVTPPLASAEAVTRDRERLLATRARPLPSSLSHDKSKPMTTRENVAGIDPGPLPADGTDDLDVVGGGDDLTDAGQSRSAVMKPRSA